MRWSTARGHTTIILDMPAQLRCRSSAAPPNTSAGPVKAHRRSSTPEIRCPLQHLARPAGRKELAAAACEGQDTVRPSGGRACVMPREKVRRGAASGEEGGGRYRLGLRLRRYLIVFAPLTFVLDQWGRTGATLSHLGICRRSKNFTSSACI